MKRHILLVILTWIGMTIQAQVLIDSNGNSIKFSDKKLTHILFDKNDITFVNEAGDSLTFNIDEIHSLGFADDYTAINELESVSKAVIAYDANAATVHIVGAKEEGEILLFNADGRLLLKVKGNKADLRKFPAGLYIVSYNKVLNAKIVKK